MKDIELFRDSFQNFKSYGIPKAQLILTDVPYNLGNNAYASNPAWYKDGDNKNGESELAGKQFFNSDKDFRPAEFMHFCSQMLKPERKDGVSEDELGEEKEVQMIGNKRKSNAPCMIIFVPFEQMHYYIELGARYGLKKYIPLVFRKDFSAQVLKANMKVVGNCEYGLILYRDKLPKFNNEGRMIFNCFDWVRDSKTPKIHPTQKPIPLLERLIEIFTDEGDVVIDPCVDCNTEYFNGETWVKMSEYRKEDKVLIYDMETGEARLEQPLKHLVQEYDKPFIRYKSYSIDIKATPDHNIVNYSTTGKIRKTPFSKVYQDNEDRVNGFRGTVPLTFSFKDDEKEYNEWYLRLMVAAQADGSRVRNGRNKQFLKTNRYKVRVEKERKAERMRFLLQNAGVSWSEGIEHNIYKGRELTYYCFSFISPYGTKLFDWSLLNAKDEYKRIILDEIKYWDGNQYGRNNYVRYSTTVKQNAEVIQMLAHSVGMSARISEDKRHDKVCYCVSLCNKKTAKLSKSDNFGNGKINNMSLEYSEDKHCYCFTVSTGAFIVRRNGKIHVTGNCAGSGTTLLAAANLGRKAYGFEIDREFYKKATDLINNHCISPRLF